MECNYDSLLTVLRAYEDFLALETSSPVVRKDYRLHVTDLPVVGSEYRIYRCGPLLDSLDVLMGELALARTSPVTASCDGPVLYDGYSYQTVQIGTQCWFKENLRNDNYRDETVIPGNLTMGQWSSTSAGVQAVFGEGVSNVMLGNGDEVANLAKYGRLYNWYAVSNPAGLCPTGWHVPDEDEWSEMETFLGGTPGLHLKLASSPSDTPAGNGSNTSGFSGLFGGMRGWQNGWFYFEGMAAFWWSADGDLTNGAYYHAIEPTVYNNGLVGPAYLRYGYSVRCIQDPPTAPTVDTGAATTVEATSVTLNATITASGGATVTATGFKYATNSALTSATTVAATALPARSQPHFRV